MLSPLEKSLEVVLNHACLVLCCILVSSFCAYESLYLASLTLNSLSSSSACCTLRTLSSSRDCWWSPKCTPQSQFATLWFKFLLLVLGVERRPVAWMHMGVRDSELLSRQNMCCTACQPHKHDDCPTDSGCKASKLPYLLFVPPFHPFF
eukprot:584933-Amphidinium_carterae.2